MLKLDDVDYKDTKLVELETFFNEPFVEEPEQQDMDEVLFKVFKSGEEVIEKEFQKSAKGKYYVNWRTAELPSPGTYKVKIKAELSGNQKVREGYLRVKPSGDRS